METPIHVGLRSQNVFSSAILIFWELAESDIVLESDWIAVFWVENGCMKLWLMNGSA